MHAPPLWRADQTIADIRGAILRTHEAHLQVRIATSAGYEEHRQIWQAKVDALELFEKKEKADCEDATNEVVAKISEAALGRALSSCAEVTAIVGGCEHEVAKMHCPASCGLCDAIGAQGRMMNHRQLSGKCSG